MSEYNGPMMLTIRKAADATGCTYYLIRNLVLTDQISFIKSGSRYYVNMPSLLAYLNGGQNADAE